jgi:RNA polymerase sigma-70 factor (ECF subfamily)
MSRATDESTSATLLKKLQDSATEAEDAWRRFVKLYTPLLFLWARRAGANEQEAPDLVQEVFVVLAREMRGFRHDPARRFRGWLWTVLVNKWRDRLRQEAVRPASADTGELRRLVVPDSAEELAEEEYRGYLLRRFIDLMQVELPAVEWRACNEHILQGRRAAEVANELGVTVNQVYLARSRILRRFRTELEGLLK